MLGVYRPAEARASVQPWRRLCSSRRQEVGSALTANPLAQSGIQRSGRCTSVRAAPPAQDHKDNAAAALQSAPGVVQLYRTPALTASATSKLQAEAHAAGLTSISGIATELCFNIDVSEQLDSRQAKTVAWLLRETYEPQQLTSTSTLPQSEGTRIVEVGPRMTFSTAWSANAVSACKSCSIRGVTRMEKSRRFAVLADPALSDQQLAAFAGLVHDRMTEQVYAEPLESFERSVQSDKKPEPARSVPLMARGTAALDEIDDEMGLAFDDWDKQYYYKLFVEDLKRDPTTVELFDLAQSNSEHCRHWFFGGALVVGGERMPETLFSMVKAPYKANPNNSVIAFKDNSSAIRGFDVTPMLPSAPGAPCALKPQPRTWDLLLTAETHNFPCAVAPFPGAETGAGGRIRDTHATGTGSIMGAATAGYCVGNLRLPGRTEPWEGSGVDAQYPASLAAPLKILIDASNGASDYGNKFGEPLIAGYTRTYGARLPSGERREWIKPIMFSGGFGQIDRAHHIKHAPKVGMLVVKVGGPAYRIGMGGGAASSVPSGSSGKADLDFNAVQRGDAEMSQKLWRVVRACVEMGDANPIVQIHDQGAGGNCNVVKEIIYPLGAEINVRKVKLGDATMSTLEIWGAEYQENDCLLVHAKDEELLQGICDRERTFMQVIGTCNGSGKIVLTDPEAPPDAPTPVDLDLETVLGDLPQKTYEFPEFAVEWAQPLDVPSSETAMSLLDKVLRLPAVGSKRFLTTKADRCVTGLVAQQQCCGPLQLPVADVAVTAQSHQGGLTGIATSIGEQPIKGLLDPAAMARLAISEALLNLVFAPVTSLQDVRASVNWMHAAKMKAEGAAMYKSAEALKDMMIELGMACDGGKDSLSMAATAGGETVMAPGNLVISAYAGCPDITQVVTPDLRKPGSYLLHVDLAKGQRRTGGSALAQVLSQLGDCSPDVEVAQVKGAFEVTQELIRDGTVLAGHDISDGGIAVTLLEMAFAGVAGVSADLPTSESSSAHATLFAEEPGLVLEVAERSADAVCAAYDAVGVSCRVIGAATDRPHCRISVGGEPAIEGTSAALRDQWEATSFQLERLQAAEQCVAAEEAGLQFRQPPVWRMSYTPQWTDDALLTRSDKPKVAILREEGSNGDREMAAAVYAAGMEPWDVTMSDLLSGAAALDDFRGIVFVGGFSYADTLDSAKGWASAIRFSETVLPQFEAFYARPDTFSLGVCNGCQLMALLGWVPSSDAAAHLPDEQQPRFVHNESERFECRWATVEIKESPAIMLRGMAGSVVGIWAAHGEGRCLFPDEAVEARVLENDLAPLRYTDPHGRVTQMYPHNPNGSPHGIAALCSGDGRHLAMMPHPERCYLGWQQPWCPEDVPLTKAGPGSWLKLFQNAREWLESQGR